MSCITKDLFSHLLYDTRSHTKNYANVQSNHEFVACLYGVVSPDNDWC